jgi:hypothetical protein
MFAIIDTEDIPSVGAYNWYASDTGGGKWYAARKREKLVYLHRFIMPTDSGIDHIDGDGLHDFKGNLRPATQQENLRNRITKRSSKSGLKGAYRFRNKWISNLTFEGKSIHIGSFDTKEEAHAAYCRKALQLYGKFAHDGVRNMSRISLPPSD